MNETTTGASDILELLEDSSVMAWYACMQDVLPLLTVLNVLFQASKPLPHLLFTRITSAKAALINMVGTGPVRTEIIPIASVDRDTSFGAYTNKFIRDHSDDAVITGTGGRLTLGEVIALKKEFYTLYAHCLEQIDARFPPDNMQCFKLMQVLYPTVVHGPLRRNQIGNDDLTVVVANLVKMFEVPLHAAGCSSPEAIKNSFILYRASDVCSDLWKEVRGDKSFDHCHIYTYYRQILQQMPDMKPWALFALFVLVFPTGNAISERGFSAMGAVHTKQRSELGHAQVLAHLMICFNGPTVDEFTELIDVESRQPNWALYIHPNNFNI